MERFPIHSKSIYVHDGGYGYRKQLASVKDAGAFTVSAFCPSTFPMEDEQGKPIAVVEWLKKQGAREGEIKSFSAFFWEKGKRYTARVVALHRTGEQEKRMVRQKKKKAGKHQKAVQDETVYLAGWLLVVTTLPAEDWDEQEVMSLYRARWQIELLFKRIKQLLDKHILDAETEETAKAKVSVILVAWLLQQEVATQMRSIITEMYREIEVFEEKREEEDEKVRQVMSEWVLQKVSVDLFRQQVQGPLTRHRVYECLSQLQRHFVDTPRKRRQQWDRLMKYLADPQIPENLSDGGKNRKTGSALTTALA